MHTQQIYMKNKLQNLRKTKNQLRYMRVLLNGIIKRLPSVHIIDLSCTIYSWYPKHVRAFLYHFFMLQNVRFLSPSISFTYRKHVNTFIYIYIISWSRTLRVLSPLILVNNFAIIAASMTNVSLLTLWLILISLW